MNPTTTQPPPPSLPPPSLPPPPPLLQPHRPSTSCDRHPQENFTGFCPSCLCERLAVLDPNSSSSSAAARKPPSSSTAAAALKTIFRSSVASRRPPPSSLPELRRTKSFSASKNEALSGFFEPQRKSCDVRGRSTLFTLFNQEAEVETRHLPSSSVVQKPVLESEEEDDEEEEEEKDNIVVHDVTDNKVPESPLPQPVNAENRVSEIVEEESETVPEPAEADLADEEALKAMKDHMDLDSQTKKTSGRDLKGSFWSAASVFSKKLQKWRQKQKMKKRERNGVVVGSGTLLPVEKPIARQFRETQSEIADYGFGRRSCDTDPRFSLDAARMSFDFEEPRASWDGYLMARTAPTFAVPPRMPTMIEDAPAPVQVLRTDSLIPVEEPEYEETLTLNLNQNLNLSVNHNVNANPNLPGGSTQTKEYYSDSSSRRRKSLDRSSSIRRTAAAVVAEMDELKSVSNASATTNAKVTPAASADYVHNPLRDSNLNSNSLRDDGCEKGASKKSSSRWSKAWSIWGLIHRRGSKEEDGGGNGNGNGNGVERSYSESWQEYRGGERNGDVRGGGGGGGGFNPKMMRSNSSVSWRNGQGLGGGGFGSVSMRKSDVQGNGLGLGLGGGGGGGKKGRDEFVGLERNRSARYSPNSIDNNGLLRLYLGGRRNGSGKGRSNQAHSIARSVLRLY
ncbi:protein OCTOPUS [Vigna unguiculata]|uniref:protein OCTOPUS n=1 Tax=Vigna unguiculata TaxID=3917 RepID=UPI001016F21F|nr:protein OCTOPUS [Vigna unguiculata]